MVNRIEYRDTVETGLDFIVKVECNPPVIPRAKLCSVWNSAGSDRPTVPGYWMSDDMEAWGKRNGYTLVWSTTKRGKRRNVMLVKNQ